MAKIMKGIIVGNQGSGSSSTVEFSPGDQQVVGSYSTEAMHFFSSLTFFISTNRTRDQNHTRHGVKASPSANF